MDKFAMIIFGASGDLTKRKLMPALYSLFREKRLTGDFHILGIGRTIYSDEDYRSYISGELRTGCSTDGGFHLASVLLAHGSGKGRRICHAPPTSGGVDQ